MAHLLGVAWPGYVFGFDELSLIVFHEGETDKVLLLVWHFLLPPLVGHTCKGGGQKTRQEEEIRAEQREEVIRCVKKKKKEGNEHHALHIPSRT